MQIEVDDYCFVCGPANPQGLGARFQAADGTATGHFEARPEHQGYAGVSHGGILAAILDEAMVYAASSLGHWVATAEMTVRYLKPAPTEQRLAIRAEVGRQAGRLIECSAEVADEAGTVLARATGKLMRMRPVREEEHPRSAS